MLPVDLLPGYSKHVVFRFLPNCNHCSDDSALEAWRDDNRRTVAGNTWLRKRQTKQVAKEWTNGIYFCAERGDKIYIGWGSRKVIRRRHKLQWKYNYRDSKFGALNIKKTQKVAYNWGGSRFGALNIKKTQKVTYNWGCSKFGALKYQEDTKVT
jgi:hypothetical protein